MAARGPDSTQAAPTFRLDPRPRRICIKLEYGRRFVLDVKIILLGFYSLAFYHPKILLILSPKLYSLRSRKTNMGGFEDEDDVDEY
ncbi:hypothetical protein BGZ89_001873 [Linnemannia elongata]|nr:hypothetical protein BGZ89_001873 [Linnemannia elongata]